MHEDLRKFSGCDDELGDEIDCIISITTELCRGRLIPTEFSIELTKRLNQRLNVYFVSAADLGKVQTCTIAAVVVIPVHMEDLLTLNRQ
jgi:hypothetical protein